MKSIEEVLEWIDGQLMLGGAYEQALALDPAQLNAVMAIRGRNTTLEQIKRMIHGEEL